MQTIKIDDSTYKEIKEIAKRTGKKIYAVVSDALEALKQKSKKKS